MVVIRAETLTHIQSPGQEPQSTLCLRCFPVTLRGSHSNSAEKGYFFLKNVLHVCLLIYVHVHTTVYM